MQGAVHCETSAAVHSRLSPYNYGVPYLDGIYRKVHWLVRKGEPVESNMATRPYALRIDDQPWLDEDDYCRIVVALVRSDEEDAANEYNQHVTPHAEIDCRVPTNLRHRKDATLIQTQPTKAWHVPAKLVLYLNGAVISFRCKIGSEEVGVAEVNYFNIDGSICTTEDDFHSMSEYSQDHEKSSPHQRADSKVFSISERAMSPVESTDTGASNRSKIVSFFTAVRTTRDAPRDKRPRVQMPGMYGIPERLGSTASK